MKKLQVLLAIMMPPLVVVSTSASAATLCDQPATTITWNLSSRPDISSFQGVKTSFEITPDNWARYVIAFNAPCSGTVSVYVHDHGKRVGSQTVSGGTTPWDRVTIDSRGGAGLRVGINYAEVCRRNDGPVKPSGSGWPERSNFDTFNLVCGDSALPLSRTVPTGQQTTIEAFRWNINAETDAGDGFRMSVTFTRQ